MHPRLGELVEYAEAQRAALLQAVATVPDTRRDERVSPECWSVAEVLEHLHKVERGIIRLSEYAMQQAREQGVGPERQTESVLHALDRFELLRRRSRIPAPERVIPTGRHTAREMLTKLDESRRTLRASLPALDGLALGEISYAHPLLGRLTIYQWLLFLGQHEARHADQIREIAGRLTDWP